MGDGLDDLGTWTSSGIYYYLHNSAGTPPDLVSSITDGYGNFVGNSSNPITYVSLAQAANYYVRYYDATYPYESYVGPLYVVTHAYLNDPSSSSGGTYNFRSWYYEAWNNVQGRAFVGFQAEAVEDSRNSMIDYRYLAQAFPYTGMLTNDYPDSATLGFYVKQFYYNAADVTLDSTTNNSRYFIYSSPNTEYDYEVDPGGSNNGAKIRTAVTTYATPDSYGNFQTITTTVTDNDPGPPSYLQGASWTTTTTNTWDEDSTHWCLSLLSEVQVTYTSSIDTSVGPRTKTFTPDTTNCRYNEIVSEPSSSSYKVTEDLTYDSFGNVATDKITGINMTARTTTATWSNGTYTTGQFPLSVEDPSGATTQYTYNYSFGELASVIDPNSTAQNPIVTTWNTWDDFGRPTKMTKPDSTYLTWQYLDSNTYLGYHGVLVVRDVYGTNGTWFETGDVAYDPLDRARVALVYGLNSVYSRVDTTYDNLGRVSQKSFPCSFSAWTTPCTYWTTNGYDVLNRLTQTQRPISSTNSNPEAINYNYAGRTTTISDNFDSFSKELVNDVNGWQRQTTDSYGYTVTTAYDAAGSVTGVTDNASHTLLSGVTWAYGIAPFKTTATDVDMGAWSYQYDALGDLTGWWDAKNQGAQNPPFTMTYDALSRPLTRSEPDYYTSWTWGSSASNDNVGQLASVCTGLGSNPTSCTSSGYSESETYDSLARLSTRAITIPSDAPPSGSAYTYQLGYSSTTGLLSTLTYPTTDASGDALQLQYAYFNGVLSSIVGVFPGSSNVTVWTANTENPAGQVTQETLGNGIVTNRSYDAVTSWLGSLTSGVSGGSGVKNLGWLYDEMGDVTQRQDNNLGLTENFYYDNDYRLTSSKLNTVQNLAITYDNTMGNILKRSDIPGSSNWTYSSTQIHAVTQAGSGTGSHSYTYDANGNAITRDTLTIGWTSYNYPTSISTSNPNESVALSYGPDRQRWQQNYNSGSETTDYIGGLLEQVFSGGTTTYRNYVYAGGEPVAVYARNATTGNAWSYFISDHQGSVAAITNSSGAVDVNESFTATGARRNPTTWSGAPSSGDLNTIAGLSRQGYTWQTALGQSMGLNHMNGRVQDAITGRFMSADPHITDPSNSQSYNRYSYVVNNPVTMMDPSGFDPCKDHFSTGCPSGGGGYTPIPGGDDLPTVPPIYKFVVTFVNPPGADSSWGGTFNAVANGGLGWNIAGPYGSFSGLRNSTAAAVTGTNQTFCCSTRDFGMSNNFSASDQLSQDFQNYLQNALEGNWGAALSAGLSYIADSWKSAFSTPQGAILTGMSMLPVVGLEADTVTVGRWMSPTELQAMQDTGLVQESVNNGVTSVTLPANPAAYTNAPAGDIYVQFDVPQSAIGAADGTWAKIYGPNSIFGPAKGITQMPPATNIVIPNP